jgi:trans-2,3-dihydro-3-hydroxyanthranilate isomerase
MPSRLYRYLHLDVFTARRFGGNQLAVFSDARGLSSQAMQAIAREMAFSETTFVLPADDPQTDARLRIFTPAAEMPMAGHPTIGSTFALAHEGRIASGSRRWVFGLGIGPVTIDLEWQSGTLSFAWMTQRTPTFGPPVEQVADVAAAVGLAEEDVRSTGLPVQEVSCGVPFLLVPIGTRAAVDRARPDARGLAALAERPGSTHLGVFLFSTARGNDDADAYSRMFAPGLGIVEDPATGSASGPLGSYLVTHGLVPPSRAGTIVNLQGVAMGRPSRIQIAVDVERNSIARVRVGGTAVLVAEGTLDPGDAG